MLNLPRKNYEKVITEPSSIIHQKLTINENNGVEIYLY